MKKPKKKLSNFTLKYKVLILGIQKKKKNNSKLKLEDDMMMRVKEIRKEGENGQEKNKNNWGQTVKETRSGNNPFWIYTYFLK